MYVRCEVAASSLALSFILHAEVVSSRACEALVHTHKYVSQITCVHVSLDGSWCRRHGHPGAWLCLIGSCHRVEDSYSNLKHTRKRKGICRSFITVIANP